MISDSEELDDNQDEDYNLPKKHVSSSESEELFVSTRQVKAYQSAARAVTSASFLINASPSKILCKRDLILHFLNIIGDLQMPDVYF